jgi:hypothetical protein
MAASDSDCCPVMVEAIWLDGSIGDAVILAACWSIVSA